MDQSEGPKIWFHRSHLLVSSSIQFGQPEKLNENSIVFEASSEKMKGCSGTYGWEIKTETRSVSPWKTPSWLSFFYVLRLSWSWGVVSLRKMAGGEAKEKLIDGFIAERLKEEEKMLRVSDEN
ncbi:unnamed protein product [Fraxinus pennsylvanica]|uniref:Uncharacterized protein n=1 Tax=Fraxinus pennsylvanica TaxID=56036 RepID=A0AAD1Z2A2_9LAMI|nr:unnamed protein product [Fraxinus pennsylvanica]